jgi:hypothetical protein
MWWSSGPLENNVASWKWKCLCLFCSESGSNWSVYHCKLDSSWKPFQEQPCAPNVAVECWESLFHIWIVQGSNTGLDACYLEQEVFRVFPFIILSRFGVVAWLIRRGLNLMIGFTDTSYTKLRTTGNYSAAAISRNFTVHRCTHTRILSIH